MREVVAFARTVADQPLDNRRSSKRTVPDAQKAERFYHGQLCFACKFGTKTTVN